MSERAMRILKRSDRQSEALPRPVAAAICDGDALRVNPTPQDNITHTEYLLLLLNSQFQTHLHKNNTLP